MIYPIISLIFFHAFRTAAVPALGYSHDHHHESPQSLPSKTWYQDPEHPVHALFRRDALGDGTTYAAVGSPSWSAPYPSSTPNPSALPVEWLNTLNAAVAAGKIPNIPQSSNLPNQNPVYPTGYDPNSPTVCSATEQCVTPGDIWDAPDGVFASSFDDGPTPSTPTLVNFLQSNNKTTTHFMIGVNILNNPTQFLTAFNAGHDIAVHTWTHPYMTTLSNMDLLGQFGWTMQIIHNSTGGRVPKFWRPPYGDSDMRVRAIAKEIFGLTTVIWNHDTEDWAQTAAGPIQAAMSGFLSSPKHPGLVILEHELTDITVNGFIQSYPLIQQNGWNFISLAQSVGNGSSYHNAQSSSSEVTPMGILLANQTTSTSTSSTQSSTSTAASSSSSSGQNLSGAKAQTSSARTLRDNFSPLYTTHSALVLAGVISLCV
ncbi:hypothetical protein CPB84DRAFT_1757852 [Gymnopilus junonius]|uniref:chitin deacetylase n=1 Tax=Gymnopilus junonius TaxID=109634 RepID=A0A9P5P4D9_GYMJU|nr:hypothetical protein CPB84DRAFT_1757852 [Gymnopilus junonius]